jgi:putative transposase
VDGGGIPLSLVVTGANRNDCTELAAVLDARVVAPTPTGTAEVPVQHLCADAGYFGKPADKVIRDHGYEPHVRSRHEEQVTKRNHPGNRPRRWVVEVSHAWFNRFRKLLVRYEKTLRNYLALNHLAAAIIAFRKVVFLYGPYGKQSFI